MACAGRNFSTSTELLDIPRLRWLNDTHFSPGAFRQAALSLEESLGEGG